MSRAVLLRPLPFVAIDGPDAAFLPARGAAAVANDYMGMVASAAAGDPLDIVVDLGAELPVDMVALLGLNALPAAGVAMLSVNDDGDFASFSRAVGGVSIRRDELPAAGGLYHPLWLGARPVRARWWRVRVAGVPGVSLRLSRLVLGQRFQPTRNFEWGISRGVKDLGRRDIGRLGAIGDVPGRRLRTLSLSFPLMPKEETEAALLPLLEEAGMSSSVLLSIDPSPHPMRHRRLYYGALTGDLATVWRSAAGFETRLRMESLI